MLLTHATPTFERFGSIRDTKENQSYDLVVKQPQINSYVVHITKGKKRTSHLASMKFHRSGDSLVFDTMFIAPKLRGKELSYGLLEVLHQYTEEKEGSFLSASGQKKPLLVHVLSQSGFECASKNQDGFYLSGRRGTPAKIAFVNPRTQFAFENSTIMKYSQQYECVSNTLESKIMYLNAPMKLVDSELNLQRRNDTLNRYAIKFDISPKERAIKQAESTQLQISD